MHSHTQSRQYCDCEKPRRSRGRLGPRESVGCSPWTREGHAARRALDGSILQMKLVSNAISCYSKGEPAAHGVFIFKFCMREFMCGLATKNPCKYNGDVEFQVKNYCFN